MAPGDYVHPVKRPAANGDAFSDDESHHIFGEEVSAAKHSGAISGPPSRAFRRHPLHRHGLQLELTWNIFYSARGAAAHGKLQGDSKMQINLKAL